MKKTLKWIAAGLLVSSAVYAAEINDLSTTDASNTARFPEGMAPSAVNNAARALEGIIARWFGDWNGNNDTGGTANTYTLSADQTLSSYYDGLLLTFEVTPTNTGATTLNVDSVGAGSVVKHGSVALESGDLTQGTKHTVIYDGSNFQLVSPVSPVTGSITSGNIPLFSGTAGKLSDSGSSELAAGTLTTEGDVLYRDSSGLQRLAVGTAGQALTVNSGATAPEWASPSYVQFVSTQDGDSTTGSTTIPLDNTIPQCDAEGDEYITRAVTPTNSSNTLIIDAVVNFSNAADAQIVAALCQDSTVDALAATNVYPGAAGGSKTIHLRHVMTAGTTSGTTFKIRAGSATAGTLTFNGIAGTRTFGGVNASTLTVTEVSP